MFGPWRAIGGLLGAVALLALLPPLAPAADAPAGGFVVSSVAVTDKPLPAFPFVPALADYVTAPADLSTWQRSADFARYLFQTADNQALEVGGRLSMRHFKAKNAGTQSLEKVVDSYRALIESQGGKLVFSGRFGGDAIDRVARSEQQAREGATFLTRTPEREIWTQVSVRDDGDEYVLVVLEKGPLVLKFEPLKAAQLKQAIDATGKAVIYVNFEFDRADLKPDAKPVLDEVYALLQTDKSLKLSIEGHTDNVGAAAYNQALSEKRAAAVLAALVSRGIPTVETARLQSVGRGAGAPIADNRTDEGRARNRRVELVKRG